MRIVNRFLAVLALTLLCFNIADAGPLLDRWREARAARNGGCQQCPQPQYVQPSGGVVYTIGGVRTGNCPGGVCPIPQAVPGQSLPVAVPGK